MIHSARLRLTLGYTLGIAVIMLAFSAALYIAVQGAVLGNLEAGGNAGAAVEHAMVDSELARARVALATVDAVGIALGAFVAYILAGRTLRPVENALDQQRRFSALASHELRTPLTVMRGEIDVALARERSPLAYREVLERVGAEVGHLEDLTRDLLTLSRADSAREQDRSEAHVRDVLERVLVSYRAAATERCVTLTAEVDRDVVAKGNWSLLQHVVRNLLDNALSHTPEGGRVELRAHQQGKELHLSVFNSGSSIAASDLPHLFEPFYRGGGEPAEGGTGLGLAFCAWVVQAHRGAITAANDAPGVRFTVRIPLV